MDERRRMEAGGGRMIARIQGGRLRGAGIRHAGIPGGAERFHLEADGDGPAAGAGGEFR